MLYEELVEQIKKSYEKSDAKKIDEHIAVQVNVSGEADGIFYIEVDRGQVFVEPYEYFDRDAIVFTSAERILDVIKGKNTWAKAIEAGEARVSGDMDKTLRLGEIKIKKPRTRTTKTKNEADAMAETTAKTISKATEVKTGSGKTKRASRVNKKG